MGPLVGYFLCRGVEGGGGPTIISILASEQEKRHQQTHREEHGRGVGGGGPRTWRRDHRARLARAAPDLSRARLRVGLGSRGLTAEPSLPGPAGACTGATAASARPEDTGRGQPCGSAGDRDILAPWARLCRISRREGRLRTGEPGEPNQPP